MKSKVSLFSILLLLALLAQLSLGQESGKLIMIQEVFRHGARFPDQVLGIGDEYGAE
jgi:hypothetical protein